VRPKNAAGPGGMGTAEAESDSRAHNAPSCSIVAHSRRICLTPEERFARYPDPQVTYRLAAPFGLSVDALRAEWKRQAAAGWQRWELETRFAPGRAA